MEERWDRTGCALSDLNHCLQINLSSCFPLLAVPTCKQKPTLAVQAQPSCCTHQVGEIISILPSHEPAGVAEASDVLDVGLQAWGVPLEHDVDQGGQEIISRGWLILGDLDGIEDVLAAFGDAGQLVPRDALGVHLNDVCKGKNGKKSFQLCQSGTDWAGFAG